VAVLPGSDFGRPPAELTARLAHVDFDGTRALAAAETMPREAEIDASFLEAYCRNVLVAVDRVFEWIETLSSKTRRHEPAKTDAAG